MMDYCFLMWITFGAACLHIEILYSVFLSSFFVFVPTGEEK